MGPYSSMLKKMQKPAMQMPAGVSNPTLMLMKGMPGLNPNAASPMPALGMKKHHETMPDFSDDKRKAIFASLSKRGM